MNYCHPKDKEHQVTVDFHIQTLGVFVATRWLASHYPEGSLQATFEPRVCCIHLQKTVQVAREHLKLASEQMVSTGTWDDRGSL